MDSAVQATRIGGERPEIQEFTGPVSKRGIIFGGLTGVLCCEVIQLALVRFNPTKQDADTGAGLALYCIAAFLGARSGDALIARLLRAVNQLD